MARLEGADLSLKLSREQGEARLAAAQKRLLALRLQLGGQLSGGQLGPPVCLLFEGWDASGKGGAIRRVTSALDPRHVTIAQFAAPNARELRHHFLWRFWPSLPGWGGMTILDRSWYGRVLVERVEKLIDESVWQRAYDEIIQFEISLAAEGMVLVKYWLHLSDKEQLRRFEAREADPLKRWKLTDEDWRNRGQRKAYEQAVGEMLERTDHAAAPWQVIAAEDKRYARVAVVETAIAAIERGLRACGQEPLDVEAAL